MTPENRARMRSVLRESLQHAYLPGSDAGADASSHGGHGHGGHGHAHAHAHATAQEPSIPLTVAGTPATPLSPGDPSALADRFCQELEALAGVTFRLDGPTAAPKADAVADQIAAILARSETTTIVTWDMEEIGVPGLAEALAARGIGIAPPDVPFAEPERAARLETLAAVGVGLTGAQAAVADSGSLVLSSGQGRGRLASLLTPVHIAILHRDRILPSLPDLFMARPELPTLGSNMVLITGPSRTADIEMSLSRGVHGPREIHVIVV